MEGLKVSNSRIVTWNFQGKEYAISFKNNLFQVEYLKARNQLLILADYEETGNRNLFVYDAKGTVLSNPKIPDSHSSIIGIYSIWFVDGNEKQTVVFATAKNENYDLKCDFNLTDFTFSEFSLTK